MDNDGKNIVRIVYNLQNSAKFPGFLAALVFYSKTYSTMVARQQNGLGLVYIRADPSLVIASPCSFLSITL